MWTLERLILASAIEQLQRRRSFLRICKRLQATSDRLIRIVWNRSPLGSRLVLAKSEWHYEEKKDEEESRATGIRHCGTSEGRRKSYSGFPQFVSVLQVRWSVKKRKRIRALTGSSYS